MSILEQKLRDISGGDILDIATGCGPNIRAVEPHLKSYRSIIGVDTSMSRLIEATTEKFPDHPSIHFACMDAYRLALPDNRFDTVMIANSLHHLEDPVAVLREMLRVARPGGRLLVFEMFCDNQTEPQMSYVLLHHWGAAIDRYGGRIHNETFPRERIHALVGQSGFRDLESFETSDSSGELLGPDLVRQLEQLIDTYPEKIADNSGRERVIAEGETIRCRLHTTGVAWPSELCVIGRK